MASKKRVEEEILLILEEAIKRERAAYQLYCRGRDLSEQEEIKGVFAMLAEEERGHEKLLKELYRDYKKQLGLKIIKKEV